MRVIVLVGVLAIATPVAAEPVRSGLMIGASLGGGGADGCRECLARAGAAFDFHVGWWITKKLAASYEVWGFIGDTNALGTMSVHGLGLITATVHVAPRWWVKAGAGFAMYQEDHAFTDELTGMDTSLDFKGFGLGTAVGYELYQSRGSFVIEASGRFGASMFPDHGAGMAGSVGVGLSWN